MTTNILPNGVPVGARIHNRYVVRDYVGGGANGAVYEVWDENQQELVALKFIYAKSGKPWKAEAAAMTALRGGFVLPILNADTEAGVPFIVTPLMPGRSLDTRIPPGVGVDLMQAITWIQQACSGMSRIHDRNLLHNDIKPENLFLDHHDKILVADLGEATLMDPTGRGAFAGSPATLAPEVAAADGVPGALPCTARSDVYSLGATLYFLIAGDWLNPAIRAIAGNRAAATAAIATHTPKPLSQVAPHVPQALNRVVMRAVTPDPADRYASPAELNAALGGIQRPRRRWSRTIPCAGHTDCFIGVRSSAATIKVCALPSGPRGRHEVQAHYANSRKAAAPKMATPATLIGTIRTMLRALS